MLSDTGKVVDYACPGVLVEEYYNLLEALRKASRGSNIQPMTSITMRLTSTIRN